MFPSSRKFLRTQVCRHFVAGSAIWHLGFQNDVLDEFLVYYSTHPNTMKLNSSEDRTNAYINQPSKHGLIVDHAITIIDSDNFFPNEGCSIIVSFCARSLGTRNHWWTKRMDRVIVSFIFEPVNARYFVYTWLLFQNVSPILKSIPSNSIPVLPNRLTL